MLPLNAYELLIAFLLGFAKATMWTSIGILVVAGLCAVFTYLVNLK